jgi:hypothetical protein
LSIFRGILNRGGLLTLFITTALIDNGPASFLRAT